MFLEVGVVRIADAAGHGPAAAVEAAMDPFFTENPKQAVFLRQAGFNRISLGVQDFLGDAVAVAHAAAPPIRALVDARGRELVDEIAFRAHDLDAVIAEFARLGGATGVVVDRRLDDR